MSSKLFAYLQLTRPANVVTAVADVWAGFAIAGGWSALMGSEIIENTEIWQAIFWLSLSTIGLYGGGVAFNDIADAKLDAVERPERPIPSGRASRKGAVLLASSLLVMGVLAAYQVNLYAGMLAMAVALCALLYDYWGKHQAIWGPINMGLCRAGNLLLGVAVAPQVLGQAWLMGLLPLAYVAAITVVSRGEVHGKNQPALYLGLGMYASMVLVIFLLAKNKNPDFWQVIPFLALLSYMIFPPLIRAIRTQAPQLIGKSVKAAVISLIIVNASLAVAFEGWVMGLLILALLPLSLGLAKAFAVT